MKYPLKATSCSGVSSFGLVFLETVWTEELTGDLFFEVLQEEIPVKNKAHKKNNKFFCADLPKINIAPVLVFKSKR